MVKPIEEVDVFFIIGTPNNALFNIFFLTQTLAEKYIDENLHDELITIIPGRVQIKIPDETLEIDEDFEVINTEAQ